MARPKKVAWQRPDIERLRTAEVQRSPVQDEVIIPAALRDQLIEYIEELERLIDERLGRGARQNTPLTPLQQTALEYDIEAGIPVKAGMFSGISARALADKLATNGHVYPNGREINEDAIDAWRKLPAYRNDYIHAFVRKALDAPDER